MSDPLAVRSLSAPDAQELRALAHSRTVEVRLRDRARISWLSHQGQHVATIQAAFGVADSTERLWITRSAITPERCRPGRRRRDTRSG